MAAYNSTQYAKQIAIPQTLLTPEECHGRIRVARASYTTAAIVAASTINMITMPKGAKYLGGYLHSDVATASLTLALGDGTTADRFCGSYISGASPKKVTPDKGSV